VIAVMGQPEDYIIEEDNHDTHSYSAAPEKQKNYTEILKRDDQRSFCRTWSLFWN
jgi:hypothetical protein